MAMIQSASRQRFESTLPKRQAEIDRRLEIEKVVWEKDEADAIREQGLIPLVSSWVAGAGITAEGFTVTYHGDPEFTAVYPTITGEEAIESLASLLRAGSKGKWVWDNIIKLPYREASNQVQLPTGQLVQFDADNIERLLDANQRAMQPDIFDIDIQAPQIADPVFVRQPQVEAVSAEKFRFEPVIIRPTATTFAKPILAEPVIADLQVLDLRLIYRSLLARSSQQQASTGQ